MPKPKGLRGTNAELVQDTTCPYCGTTVKKGVSICTGCQAEHVFEPASPTIRLVMFILGFATFILCIVIGINLGGNGAIILDILIVVLCAWFLSMLNRTDKTSWLRKKLR